MASRIVVLGDVHDEQERLEACLERVAGERFDLALLTGDVGRDPPWHHPARRRRRYEHDRSVGRVVERVGASIHCPVAFVPGNHDLAAPRAHPGGINVDGLTVDVAGLCLAGLGGSGPHRFGFPYEWSEEDADQALRRLYGAEPAPIDVFLCHCPPAGTTLDVTATGEHVGSRSVREWIGRMRPRLFVCGHIHEAFGLEWVEGVPCLNAGALGEPYGCELIWVVDWKDGPACIRSLGRAPDGRDLARTWLEPRAS